MALHIHHIHCIVQSPYFAFNPISIIFMCSTCQSHLNLPFLITKLTGSKPNSSLGSALFFLLFNQTIASVWSCSFQFCPTSPRPPLSSVTSHWHISDCALCIRTFLNNIDGLVLFFNGRISLLEMASSLTSNPQLSCRFEFSVNHTHHIFHIVTSTVIAPFYLFMEQHHSKTLLGGVSSAAV